MKKSCSKNHLGDRQVWKANYFEKASRMFKTYDKIFICDADNVTSKQFQEIRCGMRGHGDVLMGKNTMMKKTIKVSKTSCIKNDSFASATY